MKIIETVERQPVTLPISEVMDAQGVFKFVPEVRQRGYFDIDYRGNELVLVAGKFVGQIPLTSDICIHVKPKVPLSNLARLVTVANQPIHCLNFFRRKYALSLETSNSFLEGMAHSLTLSLKELDAEGVFREYKRKSELLAAPKGKIEFSIYAKRSLVRAKPNAIACTYFLLTADTTLNRLIKRTLSILGRTLGQLPQMNRRLLQEIEYFYDKFSSVKLDTNAGLLTQAEIEIQSRRIPELRAYYSDIIDICSVILREGSVEIGDSSGRFTMHSFVLSLEDTFERYIREILATSPELRSLGLLVLDGNREGRGMLFSDTNAYDAKPDYIIKSPTTNSLLGDAKYKTKLSENDRYQLISHALSFGSSNAFFVTPAEDLSNTGASRVGLVGNKFPIVISHYRFDLNAADLVAEEKKFISWIASQA